MAKSKLDKLREHYYYMETRACLAALDSRVERLIQLEQDLEGFPPEVRTTALREAEAAMGEARWQLHNLVRRLIWIVDKGDI